MSRDESTVVSIVPFAISEYKPGLFPPKYEIPASPSFDEPQCLVVAGCHYFVDVPDSAQKSFKVLVNSESLASSIVLDFLESQLARDKNESAEPGIFFIPERVTPGMLKVQYKGLIEEAKQKQTNWFIKLVKLADDDYEKARRHEVVSDTQRFAARALGLDKPYLLDLSTVAEAARITCPVCTTKIPAEAIICPTCRAVLNEQKAKQFKFAA